MQFQADFLCPWGRQEAQRFALEHQSRVSGVVDDHDMVPPRKGDDFGKELRCRARSGWVVWVLQEEIVCFLRRRGEKEMVWGKDSFFWGRGNIMTHPAIILSVSAQHR